MLHTTWMDRALQGRRSQFMTTQQVDRLIADLERIEKEGVFEDMGRTRDAGEILNPTMGTDGDAGADQPPWWADSQYRKLLVRNETHWTSAPADLSIQDLSLLEDLLGYDHWEASSSGAYGRYVQTHEHPFLFDSAITNYVPLQYLAKLRLVQGLRTGEMLPALQEVRHLAKLVYSDEMLVASMVANALLGIERQGYEAAVERDLMDPDAWSPVPEEQTHTFRRAGMTMAVVAAGWVPEGTWQRIEDLDFIPFGLCSAVSEATYLAHLQPPVSPWPLEHSPRLDSPIPAIVLQTDACRLPLVRAALPITPTWKRWREAMGSGLKLPALSAIPYVRGPAWFMDVLAERPPFVMYGDTPEEDWSGHR
ncbi:MAG: hypothetical protein QGG40_13850 [Myxococcota bacterium]|nr:hypothetical protein [Myxococcota bacterium]